MKAERLLFLSPQESALSEWLRAQGENVLHTSEKITPEFVVDHGITFLVSHGYRYILRGSVLDQFPDRAINLHISLLPWNRGADPNLWSFLEGTPKGVTIHHLDEGVDTGDIIVQKEVAFDPDSETLASSYQKLQAEIEARFCQEWPRIKQGTAPRTVQSGPGSTHRSRDKEPFLHLLHEGWDTPVRVLEEYGRAKGLAAEDA